MRLAGALGVLSVAITPPLSAQEIVASTPPAISPAAVAPGIDPPSVPVRWRRGTEVQLMVLREVNSRTAKAGDRFRLRVNAPVIVDGVTAIPVGATAWGEVIAASGTSAAGGKGRLSARLLYVEASTGQVALTGTQGVEGKGNTAGVVLGVLSWGLLGLLNKGGNALFKGGDILTGYIDEGEAPIAEASAASE